MATKLKPVETSAPDADVETYVSLASALDESLKAERAAHKRLITLVRKIEARDEQRRTASTQ